MPGPSEIVPLAAVSVEAPEHVAVRPPLLACELPPLLEPELGKTAPAAKACAKQTGVRLLLLTEEPPLELELELEVEPEP